MCEIGEVVRMCSGHLVIKLRGRRCCLWLRAGGTGRDGGGERGREGSVDGDDLCGEIRPETVTFKAF